MKILDVFMVSLAVAAYLHEAILSDLIIACVAVYFVARIAKVCFQTEEN